ncbi:hypothetical protein [Flavobacterium rhizosphaerae]|uniref:Outer membrane protein beta-barrel domain-containing protein n=1 Tax=Flavobacterium rhizosphaerae TaxID=3163298 RepID=A0ABW8Z1P7_9FLAO
MRTLSTSLLLSMLCLNFAVAQHTEIYPDFKDYSKVGLCISPVLYTAAKTTRDHGDYSLDNHATFNFNFGFDYLIHPERKLAFKTGLHLDMVPMYNINMTIKDGDLWTEGPYTDNITSKYKLNFTIPALIQIKKQMAYNVYFSLDTGFHIMIMQEGGYDVNYIFTSPDGNESREVFALYANTNNPACVYPNAIISPGFYVACYGMLIQGSIIYQKPLVPFFKGEYQFGNLLQSAPTRGDYSLSGQYLGLSFNIHLKKEKEYRNKIEQQYL